MKSLYLFAMIMLAWACDTQPQQETSGASSEAQKDSLAASLKLIHKQGQINGFGVAIVSETGSFYTDGIGYADVKNELSYTENTIQNIGSVSKTFIGVALMKAQELGKLHLDDPINQYLPFDVYNPSYPDVAITIRHLATHTSTILDTDLYNQKAYVLADPLMDSTSLPEISETFNPAKSKTSILKFLEKLLSEHGEWYLTDGFLENAPGEIYEYSNVGATLAAAVLESATGKSFDAFTTQHILDPLAMTSSGWSFEAVDTTKHSVLYAKPDTELPYYSLITYPDGGLITSVSDLSKYLSELIKGYLGKGSLLSTDSYQELFKQQLVSTNFIERDQEDDYDDEYNSGIFMGFSPKGYIGHIGGDPGIATFMFFNPNTKTGRIIMINTSVRNSEGVDQFYAIWNKLEEYESLASQGI